MMKKYIESGVKNRSALSTMTLLPSLLGCTFHNSIAPNITLYLHILHHLLVIAPASISSYKTIFALLHVIQITCLPVCNENFV